MTNEQILQKINDKDMSDFTEEEETFGLYFISLLMPTIQIVCTTIPFFTPMHDGSYGTMFITIIALLLLGTVGLILDIVGVTNALLLKKEVPTGGTTVLLLNIAVFAGKFILAAYLFA